MISREKGRDIAGQELIKKFGREYLIKNKERLTFLENITGGILTVDCGLFKNMDTAPVERDGAIYVEETLFPDDLLTVQVNLRGGSAKVME